VKWLVIHTRLCDEEAYKPLFNVVEADGLEELWDELDRLERNDMSITAVPLGCVMALVDRERVDRVVSGVQWRGMETREILSSIEVALRVLDGSRLPLSREDEEFVALLIEDMVRMLRRNIKRRRE